MKNETIRLALAMTALGTVLLSLSCGGVNQNGNTAPTLATTTNASPSPFDDTCSGTPAEKVQKIDQAINEVIDQDRPFKDQRDAKTFSISTSANGDVISVRIAGKVAGGDNIRNFVKMLAKYIKKDCIQSVKFESSTTAAMGGTDFEWILCEPPMNACPNGECRDTCQSQPFGKTASNSNMNTNSNSNKGNTNRP